MDWNRIKHLLSLKSVLLIIITNVGIILNTAGVFDSVEVLEQYKIISTSILLILEVIGVVKVYQTEPITKLQNDK